MRITQNGLRKFRLNCEPRQYSSLEGATNDPNHCSEGFELLESAGQIAFQLDIPALLTLICGRIAVEELPRLVETVEPWLSDREVWAETPTAPKPTAADWIDLFAEEGENVTWHLYGGGAEPASSVPEDRYDGWLLQRSAELDAAHQGVSFFGCSSTENGFRLHVENIGTAEGLWHTMLRIIGHFQDITVHCGNCEFTGPEWLTRFED